MPISPRVVVTTTVALLTVGFIALIAIVGMTVWLNEQAQIYVNESIQARDTRTAAVDLRNELQSAESSQRGFLVQGNEIYLAPYDNAKVNAKRKLERILSLLSEPRAMMVRLSEAVAEKLDEMDRTVVLKRSSNEASGLELFRSNRGKLLMDEINVFLSSIIRNADAQLTAAMVKQKISAERLRLASGLGGIVIILVVGGVTILGARYAGEIAEARDQVHGMNVVLERRVEERTSALSRALERAEMLLSEVNHRVSNSLSLVASLVKLQARSVQDASAKDALRETEARIYAIADVHRKLYASGDVGVVALNEYLADLLNRLERTMHGAGHGARLKFDLAPINSTADASVNLGVVMNEWVTNAFKYAYPESQGEIRVRLHKVEDDLAELIVEDDGIGMKKEMPARGTGLGSKLVTAMAANLKGKVHYEAKAPGTSARLLFSIAS